MRVAELKDGKIPKWLKCMVCKEKTSFCPEAPKYHRLLIELINNGHRRVTEQVKKEKIVPPRMKMEEVIVPPQTKEEEMLPSKGYTRDSALEILEHRRRLLQVVKAGRLSAEHNLDGVKDLFTKGLATKADYSEALRGYQNAVEEMRSAE